MDLSELDEMVDTILSIEHTLHLLNTVILILTARICESSSAAVLIKTSRSILALLDLCENELDALNQVVIDIRALRLVDYPPFILLPQTNRSIDELQLDFAHQMTRFIKDQLRKLFVHLRLPATVILPSSYHRHSPSTSI